MNELSEETKRMLKDEGISCHYNEETGKYELHYPGDMFEYWSTEEEIVANVKDYIEFCEKNL